MKLKSIKSNMAELHLESGVIVLFSYETPVAYFTHGNYYITTKHWSATTTRHINQWVPGDHKLRQHTMGVHTVSQEHLYNLVLNKGGK